MAFLTEPEPERGAVLPVLPGISRIVAANSGPMTYYGTNTYLIETPDGLVVLDPGPDEPAHVEAILRATGGKVDLILLSHFHHDHVEATPALKSATGAPTAAFRDTAIEGFVPDTPIDDNATIAGMTAIHTPGHASDHLCFELAAKDGTAVLFSADHVMSWNSTVVSPPDGDMRALFRQPEAGAGPQGRCVPARPWPRLARTAQADPRAAVSPHGARAEHPGPSDEGSGKHAGAAGCAVFADPSAAAARGRAQRAVASAETGRRRER